MATKPQEPDQQEQVQSEGSVAARLRTWERHVQTILMAATIGVMSFASKAVWDSNTAQAQMAVRIEGLTNQVAELRGAVGSMQQQYVLRAEFAVHEQRIQLLEGRHK